MMPLHGFDWKLLKSNMLTCSVDKIINSLRNNVFQRYALYSCSAPQKYTESQNSYLIIFGCRNRRRDRRKIIK